MINHLECIGYRNDPTHCLKCMISNCARGVPHQAALRDKRNGRRYPKVVEVEKEEIKWRRIECD